MNTAHSHLETAGGRALQDTLDRVAKGIRDPEASRQALERLDKAREEMRQRVGVVEVAVELIRETRDQ